MKIPPVLCPAGFFRLSKNYVLKSDNRAAGELEGARPASNRINRRRKRGQKSPVRTFLTSNLMRCLILYISDHVVREFSRRGTGLFRGGDRHADGSARIGYKRKL